MEDGTTEEFEDPYRFAPVITKEDTARFAAGIHYEAYRILGAHMMTIDKTKGVHFAVWAPNALRVSVVGDFNRLGWTQYIRCVACGIPVFLKFLFPELERARIISLS